MVRRHEWEKLKKPWFWCAFFPVSVGIAVCSSQAARCCDRVPEKITSKSSTCSGSCSRGLSRVLLGPLASGPRGSLEELDEGGCWPRGRETEKGPGRRFTSQSPQQPLSPTSYGQPHHPGARPATPTWSFETVSLEGLILGSWRCDPQFKRKCKKDFE